MKRLSAGILAVLWVLQGAAFAQYSAAEIASISIKAQSLLDQAVENGSVTGIIAGAAYTDRIVWEGSAGFANANAEVALSSGQRLRIASIAKPMTAVAVLQLHENGALDLDAPIQTYLPEYPEKTKETITARQLLQHSAGIPEYASKKELNNTVNYPSLSDAVAIFSGRELISVPGSEFHYSSYGYVLLGRLIEVISGQTFEQYMFNNIWKPAGMSDTGIAYPGAETSGQLQYYHKNDKGKIKPEEPINITDRIPGGGFYSTVGDVLRFGQALLRNTLIDEDNLRLMLEDSDLKTQGNGYGMGFYLYGENPDYGKVVGHTGGQLGVSGQFFLLPEAGLVTVVLSNTSGAMSTTSNLAVQLFGFATPRE